MQEQFELIAEEPQIADWSIDDHTRSVGRQGIATARAILESRAVIATAA